MLPDRTGLTNRMTKLSDYLEYLPADRTYTAQEIEALQQFFDRARERLDISDTDPRRIRLALMLFELASHPLAHSAVLLERVVLALRMSR